MNLKRSVIVNISLTKGIFLSTNFFVKIEAASIGKDAFFEPEIFIVPLILFFPFINNLCI